MRQIYNFVFGLLLLTTLAAISVDAQQNTAPPAETPILRLTLQDALDRARRNSVTYQAAATEARIAHEDKKQSVAALLPSVNYDNSAIYTEGTGAGTNSVKFVANNAVHEYFSQGNIHQTLDVAGFAGARRASALAAAARARAEVAARGLVVTVVQNYFAVTAARAKLEAAQSAADEGERFLKLTQDLEHGGEVAHSDVIKAELQANDRSRQLQEAKLALLNARLDLSVLIFSDFTDNFDLAEDLHASVPLPTLVDFQAKTGPPNPEVSAAIEGARAAGDGVFAARAAYLPALSFDYFYGIDATHFATKTDGVSNLGSSVVATLNIPIWNWGTTQSKIKQAELQRDQANRELSLAQRKLTVQIRSLYAEAQAASDELANLQRSSELGAESLRLTTLRYKNGESTVLEVVDAQNTAMLSNAAYQDGAVRYRVGLANLQTLTGTLTTP